MDLKGSTIAAKAKVVDVEEEDWLAPPPPLPKPVSRPMTEEDSALRELRYTPSVLKLMLLGHQF